MTTSPTPTAETGPPPARSEGGPAPGDTKWPLQGHGGSERSERGGTGPLPGRSEGGPAPSGGSERSERGGTGPSRFDAATCDADAPATDRQREQIERSLVSALGPAADGLVHALREARTVRDLLDVITTAQSAIALACGRDAASEFASHYRGLPDE